MVVEMARRVKRVKTLLDTVEVLAPVRFRGVGEVPEDREESAEQVPGVLEVFPSEFCGRERNQRSIWLQLPRSPLPLREAPRELVEILA